AAPGEQLVDDRARLAEADLADPRADGIAVAVGELGVQLDVDPLRLPDLARELLDRVADPGGLAVSELARLEQRLLGHLITARLDHRQRVTGSDDDEVEGRLLH